MRGKLLAQSFTMGTVNPLQPLIPIRDLHKQIRDNPHPGAIGQLDTLTAYGAKHGRGSSTNSCRPAPLHYRRFGLGGHVEMFLRQFQNTYSSIRIDSRIGLEEHEIPETLKIVIFE